MRSHLALNIADEKFDVTCEPEKKTQILEAAQLVNNNIEDIRKHGKTVGANRIAIMAALNIASELIEKNTEKRYSESVSDNHIGEVLRRIEATIDEFKHTKQ